MLRRLLSKRRPASCRATDEKPIKGKQNEPSLTLHSRLFLLECCRVWERPRGARAVLEHRHRHRQDTNSSVDFFALDNLSFFLLLHLSQQTQNTPQNHAQPTPPPRINSTNKQKTLPYTKHLCRSQTEHNTMQRSTV